MTSSWNKADSTTLLSAADLIDVIDALTETGKIDNQHLAHVLDVGGITDLGIRYNLDTATNYAVRNSLNGSADVTFTSQTSLQNVNQRASDILNLYQLHNLLAKNKLGVPWTTDEEANGQATAPSRTEGAHKWANTSAQISQIQAFNQGAGSYDTDSNLSWFTGILTGVAQLGTWTEVGRTILTSAGDTITVDNLPNKRYLMWLWRGIPNGTITPRVQANSDAGSNYALRASANGGAESTASNAAGRFWFMDTSSAVPSLGVGIVANLAGREKLAMHHSTNIQAVGAASAPNRREEVGKWANSSNPIDEITAVNIGGGDFDIGTELVILGWAPADIATTESNFWVPLAETILTGSADTMGVLISPKKYLWLQWYVSSTPDIRQSLTFNDDIGSNYSRRSSVDGGADATDTSGTSIQAWPDLNDLNYYYNIYIVNESDQEKLLIGQNVSKVAVGSGTAPSRTQFVAKWVNTTSPIVKIDIDNNTTGDYLAGSFMRVWGHD